VLEICADAPAHKQSHVGDFFSHQANR
jgi:hypothetical protein